jgi:hypothetical protein
MGWVESVAGCGQRSPGDRTAADSPSVRVVVSTSGARSMCQVYLARTSVSFARNSELHRRRSTTRLYSIMSNLGQDPAKHDIGKGGRVLVLGSKVAIRRQLGRQLRGNSRMVTCRRLVSARVWRFANILERNLGATARTRRRSQSRIQSREIAHDRCDGTTSPLDSQ